MPSTAAESGTTAIVALSHSLVLTAFFLNFYDFGHACSKPITGSDYHSVSINICVCLGLIQLKIPKKIGIEVQL